MEKEVTIWGTEINAARFYYNYQKIIRIKCFSDSYKNVPNFFGTIVMKSEEVKMRCLLLLQLDERVI